MVSGCVDLWLGLEHCPMLLQPATCLCQDVDWDVFEDEDLHVSVNIVFDVWDVDTNNKCFGHNAIRNIIARFLPSQFFVSLNDPILTSHLNLKKNLILNESAEARKKLNHY